VLGLLVSKLLVHPLLGLAGVLAALHTGLLPSDTGPLMVLVMLLVWAAPTAVLTHSLATMLQVGRVGLDCHMLHCKPTRSPRLPVFLMKHDVAGMPCMFQAYRCSFSGWCCLDAPIHKHLLSLCKRLA
jgi:hypothetical protein